MSDSGDIPAIVNGLAGVEEPNTMGEGISRTVDDIRETFELWAADCAQYRDERLNDYLNWTRDKLEGAEYDDAMITLRAFHGFMMETADRFERDYALTNRFAASKYATNKFADDLNLVINDWAEFKIHHDPNWTFEAEMEGGNILTLLNDDLLFILINRHCREPEEPEFLTSSDYLEYLLRAAEKDAEDRAEGGEN